MIKKSPTRMIVFLVFLVLFFGSLACLRLGPVIKLVVKLDVVLVIIVSVRVVVLEKGDQQVLVLVIGYVA